MLSDSERSNLLQLENLNQRGGRMLTVVDLIEAGTLSVEMAATAMYALAQGTSLLTAARPGGAGKTTLLAALLNLLPPQVRIITVESPSVVRQALQTPAQRLECYLVHEIGDGAWYGYLWGKAVADYFRLIARRRRIASCLHADTMEEIAQILQGPPLGVAHQHLQRVGLFAIIHVDHAPLRGPAIRRRVAVMECRAPFVPESFRFIWNATSDQFATVTSHIKHHSSSFGSSSIEAWFETPVFLLFRRFIETLLERDTRSLGEVRQQVLVFYREHPELVRE